MIYRANHTQTVKRGIQMNILQQEIQKALAENSRSDIPTADFSKVAELLKTHPELVNSQDGNGNTLLHLLILPIKIEGLQLQDVLAYNPNPFIKNNNGFTPRMCAIQYKHHEVTNIAHLHPAQTEYYDDMLSAYESTYQAKETAKTLSALFTISSLQKYQSEGIGNNFQISSPYPLQPVAVNDAKRQAVESILNLEGDIATQSILQNTEKYEQLRTKEVFENETEAKAGHYARLIGKQEPLLTSRTITKRGQNTL